MPLQIADRLQFLLESFNLAIERPSFPKGNSINVLRLIIDRLKDKTQNFIIVQIGANDGMSGDPVYPIIQELPHCVALLVEPIPSVFDKLQQNYSNCLNVKLENCAIAHQQGEVQMYRVKEDQSLPKYTQKLASFNRDVILKQKRTVPNIENFIETVQVPAKTIGSLLNSYSLTHVNYLQIDTEGFDFEVVKMTFDSGFRPDIINFESSHLSPHDKRECGSLLVEHGYQYLTIGRDTLAAKSSLL